MKLLHLSILIISLSIDVAGAEDEALTIRKDGSVADVVGVWKSTRSELTLFPDRRFEMGPGPKISYGIWEESKDRGFYLRFRARNTTDAGSGGAAHFLFEQGEIVFNHDDEVERLKKVGEVELLNPEEFPLFGKLPELGREWVLKGNGSLPEKEAPSKKGAYEWSWATFTNVKTGDIISFAADRFTNMNRSVADSTVKQSACDMFPGGLPRFMFHGMPGWSVADTIRCGVITIGEAEALEYSFVYESESASAPNRLGHGYALAFRDTIIFVQHTSEHVITTEDANAMAESVLYTHPSRGHK